MKYLLLALVAGCGVIQSNSSSTLPGASGGSAPSPAGADSNGMVTMPNLVGMTEDQAAAAVRSAGFKNEMEHSSPISCTDAPVVAEGQINCQSTDAGAVVKSYTLIQVAIFHKQHLEGMLVREQLKPMIGMKVEAAKAYLKKLGYTGKFSLENPQQFIAHCAIGTVCEVSPEDGVSINDTYAEMSFMVNVDSVKISTPDP